MKKIPYVTKEKAEEIAQQFPTPFYLYDEKGIRDNAQAVINLFREAWFQHKTIAAFPTDGNGGGLDADFVVTSWKENQQNNAPISYDFTLMINADTRVPTLYAPAASGTSGSAIQAPDFSA